MLQCGGWCGGFISVPALRSQIASTHHGLCLQGTDYCNGGQHDSQEVLNWFLQILSEAHNRAAPPKPAVTGAAAAAAAGAPAAPDANSTATESSTTDTASAAFSGPRSVEGSDKASAAEAPADPLGAAAELAWSAEQARESSVVHDLFRGQSQSCVVCNKCGTASYTYETFTSLQVSLHKEGTNLKRSGAELLL
jgi:Ubiquitin carboxyl-terminal hydrolase